MFRATAAAAGSGGFLRTIETANDALEKKVVKYSTELKRAHTLVARQI